MRVDSSAGNDVGSPLGTQMILGGIKDRNKNADGSFGIGSCGLPRTPSLGRILVYDAAGQKRAGEIADAGYNSRQMVAPVPESIVGGLVPEDLRRMVSPGLYGTRKDDHTSMRPTTMDKLGI